MMKKTNTETNPPYTSDSDHMWGAKNIAQHLGLTERQVRYAEQRRQLPIGRVGGRLYASRRKIDEYLEHLAFATEGDVQGGTA